MSLVILRSPLKWLNIVINLNGILCHCLEKAATNMMPFVNDVKEGIRSSTIPTIVEPKAVFMWPSLVGFLTANSKFAARVFILELSEEVYS
jgi:hypothetical protein